jgi:hypothetical protein
MGVGVANRDNSVAAVKVKVFGAFVVINKAA